MQLRSFVLVCGILLYSCSEKKNSTDEVKESVENVAPLPLFKRYVASLDVLELPIDVTGSLTTDGEVYDYGDFAAFKAEYSDKPFGLLFQRKDTIITVDLQIADIYVPSFVAYDSTGKILDVLRPFKKTEFELDHETLEHVYVDTIGVITVVSQTNTWELNGDRRIESSMKSSSDTVIYKFSMGKFKMMQ